MFKLTVGFYKLGLRVIDVRASKFIIWAVKEINWASYLNLFHFIKKAVFI